MAKLIKIQGDILEVDPKDQSGRFTLEEMQNLVGGYIEIVHCRLPVPDDESPFLIVNEEGLLMELMENIDASNKAGIFLVGDVLQLTTKEWNATMEVGCNEVEESASLVIKPTHSKQDCHS